MADPMATDVGSEREAEMLAQMQDLTNADDIGLCLRILQSADWNLPQAVEMYFASVQPAGTATGSARLRGTGSGSAAGVSGAINQASLANALNRVQQAAATTTVGGSGGGGGGGGGIPPPYRSAERPPARAMRARAADDRDGAAAPAEDWTVMGSIWKVVSGVGGFVWQFLVTLIPGLGQAAIGGSAHEDAAAFINSFDTDFGPVHPRFFEGTHRDAIDHCRRNLQVLLIYIHSPDHQDTHVFCSETLCNNEVADYINDNMACWASSVHSQEGHLLAARLGATTFPFLAVVAVTPHQSRLVVSDRIEGYIGPGELVARLDTAVGIHNAMFAEERERRDQREIDRLIREEQDAAYQQSLMEDQRREAEQRAIEESQREAERARVAAEREAEEREERRLAKIAALKASVPEEPAEDAENVCRIQLRLPDGSRVERRFLGSDPMGALLDFVGSHDLGTPDNGFSLTATFPRRTFADRDVTLAEADLLPQSSLFVVEPDDGAGDSSEYSSES